MKTILVLLLAVLYSCASGSAEWTSWKQTTVKQSKQRWRWCTATLDGVGLHRKGLCYVSQECRTRNPWYSGEKVECRRLQLFCAHGDVDCMEVNGIFSKVIVDKENLK